MIALSDYRELAELFIVALASVVGCLSFVWWQRSLWLREMAEQKASYERDRADDAEAYKIQLRELDSFNAAERRRLQDEIDALKNHVVILQSQRDADWAMLRSVLSERGISVPKAAPPIVTNNIAGNYNNAGDTVAGGKGPR